MLFLELFIRIAGITLLLLMAVMCLRDARDVRPARFGFLLAITLSAVLATSVSDGSFAPPVAWRYLFAPLSSTSAVFIWWFCLSLFDDDFRLGPVEWGFGALWIGLGAFVIEDFILMEPIRHEWAAIARGILAMALVGHIVFVALKGRAADLIEIRRHARIFIAVAISALFLIDIMSERLYDYFYTPLAVNIVQLSAMLVVICWSALWLLRLDRRMLTFERRSPPRPETSPVLTAKETTLQQKLSRAMDEEKAYLDPALSIGALAEKVGAPEHQLRALINKSMGHRNFRSYLNGYRMNEAKAALADPEKAGVPILTIAMDSGFASLASFNRAFKQTTGSTPSDFRNAAFSTKPPAQN